MSAVRSSSFNGEFINTTSGIEAVGGVSSSSFDSSDYAGQQGATAISGFESVQGGNGNGFGSVYESNPYSAQGGTVFGDFIASGYQNYDTPTGNNIDLATAAFNATVTNKDGSIDTNEFHQFIGSQVQYVY